MDAFPRHPAHERRGSDTSTVYEVETGDGEEKGWNFGFGSGSGGGGEVKEGMGYASDYENRGRWGLKGKKEAVGEDELYGLGPYSSPMKQILVELVQ